MSCLEAQRAFCAWLEDGEGMPLPGVERARLAVHRNTFVGTLVAALAESYPVTRALAGADFFDAAAKARVLSEPPISPVLTDYLVAFPGFLAGFGPAAAVPVLAEMAQLEALRMRAFNAADAEAVALSEFQSLARDAALLERTGARLHPSAHWLSPRHALLELWRVHVDAEDIATVDLGDIDAAVAQDLLVHRPRFEVRLHQLPEGAIAFLGALADGTSLAQAFLAASRSHPMAQPAVLFTLLLREGLVVELFDIQGTNHERTD